MCKTIQSDNDNILTTTIMTTYHNYSSLTYFWRHRKPSSVLPSFDSSVFAAYNLVVKLKIIIKLYNRKLTNIFLIAFF